MSNSLALLVNSKTNLRRSLCCDINGGMYFVQKTNKFEYFVERSNNLTSRIKKENNFGFFDVSKFNHYLIFEFINDMPVEGN
jgi:hypothetical protein